MTNLPAIIRTLLAGLVLGALASTPNAGCIPDDCEPRDCADFAGDLDHNGRIYEKCLVCNSSGECISEIKDEDGNTLFYCDDREDDGCLEGTVDAQFAYCGI